MTSALIVRLTSLGDVAQALPVAKLLGARLDRIGWIVEERCATLLDHADFPVERLIWRRGLRGALALRNAARSYDWALDIQGNWKSSLITWLLGAQSRAGLAARDRRERGTTLLGGVRARAANGPHVLDRACAVINCILEEPVSPAQLDSPPFLRAERPERSRVEASLDRLGVDRSKPLLAVVASRQNDPRSWPLDTAARLVASSATSAFLLAGPAEADLDLESAGVRVLRQGAAIADLVALGALIAESRGAVVGNDRGATHVLRAAGARTVFLFGPQDPLRTGPLRGEVLVSRDSLACRPCLARTCHHRDGPVCMSRIPVEDVLEVLG